MSDTVFVVFSYGDFIGCYSTKEKAQNYVDEAYKKERKDFLDYWNANLGDLNLRFKDFDSYYSYVKGKNTHSISEINIQ